jgi:hypothetical protein
MAELSNLEIKLNLRPLDLETLFKFIPEAIKQDALPKNATLAEMRDIFNVLADAIGNRRIKKAASLRSQLHKGSWVFVRWGKKPALGKTFLGVVKETPSMDRVGVFTSKGFTYVPIWWCQKVFSHQELEPVKSWGPGPDLPENHPTKTDDFLKKAFDSGFLEPLRKDVKEIAIAFSSWNPRQIDLMGKIKRLDDDELAAVFHAVSLSRLSKEKSRLERSHLDQISRGSWILIEPDLSVKNLEVVLIDHLHETEELIVWYPDEDTIEKIPEHWFAKHLVQKKRLTINQEGQVEDQDRAEFSRPFRLLKLQDETKSTRNTLLQKSLRLLPKDLNLSDWLGLWSRQKSSLHKLIRERGQNLLDWYGRWQDPQIPNKASTTSLLYEASRPLVVLLVLSYVDSEEQLADFVRAEIDLFEGTVKAKDKSLQTTIAQIVK